MTEKPFFAIKKANNNLTVADAIAPLQETLNKLAKVISSRDAAVETKTNQINLLQTEIEADTPESQKAKAVLEKLNNLLS